MPRSLHPSRNQGVSWGWHREDPRLLKQQMQKSRLEEGRSRLVYCLSGGVFRASSPSCSSYGERRQVTVCFNQNSGGQPRTRSPDRVPASRPTLWESQGGQMLRDGEGLRRVCTGRVRSTLAVRSLPVRIGVPRRILRTRAPLSLVTCGRDMPFWPFRH